MSEARRSIRFLFMLLLIESVLLGGLGIAFATNNISLPTFMIAMPLLAAPVGIAIIVTLVRLSRQRRAELIAALADIGFTVVATKTSDAKADAFEPFSACKALRHGHKGVRLAARGEIEGLPVHLIQHTYTVSTGQSSTTIVHVAAATPVPQGWPRVKLSGEHLGHKLAGLFGKNDQQLENEAFNKAWHLDAEGFEPGAAEAFTVLLLSPAVQDFLTPKPKSESWEIGRGWIVCLRQASAKPETLTELANRVTALRAMLPPELDEYRG